MGTGARRSIVDKYGYRAVINSDILPKPIMTSLVLQIWCPVLVLLFISVNAHCRVDGPVPDRISYTGQPFSDAEKPR